MKNEISKNSTKTLQKVEDHRVDIHDDNLMVFLGIRPPHKAPKDNSVWRKTSYEKRALREVKNNRIDMRFHNIPTKPIPVRAKLIIQLKKNNKFPNTTYSTECWMHEIGNILAKYVIVKDDKYTDLVSKYSYNGKTYTSKERPFWPGN